jgi:hypothetical protein
MRDGIQPRVQSFDPIDGFLYQLQRGHFTLANQRCESQRVVFVVNRREQGSLPLFEKNSIRRLSF